MSEMKTWDAGRTLYRSDFLSRDALNAPQPVSVSITVDDGRQFGAWTGHPLSEYIPFAGERFTVKTHWGYGEENHYTHIGPYLVVIPDAV